MLQYNTEQWDTDLVMVSSKSFVTRNGEHEANVREQ